MELSQGEVSPCLMILAAKSVHSYLINSGLSKTQPSRPLQSFNLTLENYFSLVFVEMGLENKIRLCPRMFR